MKAEQNIAVVIFAVDRILADVVQRVMHPAHVPFIAETEPAKIDRARHLRPCGGFFRGRGRLRETGKHFGVEAAQEIDRFKIFPAAIFVRDPSRGGPAVIEIEHGSDRIDPQSVDAITLEPEQRVRHQEIHDFGAAVIVDQRAPVEMAALLRIGVLVERRAVEIAEAMRIVWEMPGYPVQHHPETFAMAGVDQGRKIRRRAEAAGGGVQAGRLIAP